MMNMLKNLHFWRVWLPPHVMAAVGWWYTGWDWRALAAFFVFYTLISGLGVAVGLHRYFSHRSFSTSRFWEQVMLYTSVLACHGNALFWVALHRVHHKWSDTEKDLHSPITHSVWESYQGYAFNTEALKTVPIRLGGDFIRESSWQWNVKHYNKVLWLTWIVVIAVSWLLDAPWIVTGLALAQVWAIHQEAVVNVLGHTKGFGAYRNFETEDKSVNRWLLGLLTWGQALHNNHHAKQTKASFAHRWFEFDPCMLWIHVIGKVKQ